MKVHHTGTVRTRNVIAAALALVALGACSGSKTGGDPSPGAQNAPSASPGGATAVPATRSTLPLEIVQATLSPSQIAYPFTGAEMRIVLQNNSAQRIGDYNYRFSLEGVPYFSQSVGNDLVSIAPGETYTMDASYTKSVLRAFVRSCDTYGLDAGSHSLHLKISTNTDEQLDADTTGPGVHDALIPFDLTTACQKK